MNDFIYREPLNVGGFIVQPMNQCVDEAHKLSPIVPLYPNIVVEGDLCVLFGQSGIGKTIFAMQIACHIAKSGKWVLYVDCEMTVRQLGNRYATPNFPSTFLRAQIDPDHPAKDILKGIEEVAAIKQVDVIFLDNITALGHSLEKGGDAGPIMDSLNTLKKKYGWTLVVLNHIPKMFSGNVPLSLSAMQGSAKISQLVDDAIGMAQSRKSSNLVYVKQCKWRNSELTLTDDHVAIFERGLDSLGNLVFTSRGYASEREHLDSLCGYKEQLKNRVKELKEKGLVQIQIGAELGITQSMVSRLLKET